MAIIDGMSAVLITWLQVHFIAETSWERNGMEWKTTLLQKYSGFGLAPALRNSHSIKSKLQKNGMFMLRYVTLRYDELQLWCNLQVSKINQLRCVKHKIKL